MELMNIWIMYHHMCKPVFYVWWWLTSEKCHFKICWKSKDARGIQVSALYNVQSHIMKIRMLTRLWPRLFKRHLQFIHVCSMHVRFAFHFHFTLSLFILELISYLLNFYSLNKSSHFSRSFRILQRQHEQWAHIHTTYITIPS